MVWKEFRFKKNRIIRIMIDEIYFGDCLDIMPNIPDGSVDLILADLPFNMTKNKWDILIPFDQLWENYNRVIKPNGAIVLFAQGLFAAQLIMSNPKMYRYDLIYKKSNRVSGFLNANRQPLRNHEQILVFYKKQPTYNPQFTEGIPLHSKGNLSKTKQGVNNNYGVYDTSFDDRAGSTQKFPKSVLDFERPHPSKHPTEKPVKLCEWLISTYTNENEIVLDNTMGIGTTCVAAKNLNRRYIGIEKDEKYYKIALDSLV
jgi:site-specific DNA-methyltransferase (adenine-specific)